MNLQEQLRAFQQKRNEAADRQLAIMDEAAKEDRTLDEEEESEYESLKTELKAIDSHLSRLREQQQDEAEKANGKGSQVTSAPNVFVKRADPDDKFPGQSFTRRVIAKAEAYLSQGEFTPGQIAEKRWGKSHPTLVRVIKAGVAGGGTGGSEWGAELVQADTRYTGDFIEFLYSMTVFNRLPLREVPAHVVIKGQDGAATGFWVGESKAIPASAQDYSTVSLTPLKVAAISVVSNELIKHSSPGAEMLVRDSLVQAAAQRIDTTFVGTAAASAGVSPAGLLNGLSSLGSNGITAAALRDDIRELYAPFLAAKHARGLYLVMTPALAKSISLMVNALGQTEFPNLGAEGGTLLGDPVVTGENVGATHLILLDPREIFKIGDTGIEVSISRDATIEQDSAPQGASDTPVAASATLSSMFQTESTAFKVVQPLNYAKRRSSAVAFIGDAQYGITGATTA